MTQSADVTIRSLIDEIEAEARETDVTPTRASEMVVRLSSLYSNVLQEMGRRQFVYNRVLADAIEVTKAAARAKVRAQATNEYAELQETVLLEKSTLQLIQSLKVLAKVKAEEMRLAR